MSTHIKVSPYNQISHGIAVLFLWDTSFHIFHFLSKRETDQKNNIHTCNVLMLNFKICSLEQKFFCLKNFTSLQNDVMAKNSTIHRLPCQTETNPKLYFLIRPLLDNGLKGGNSESPERASICNHFGVCLSVCL